MMTTATTALDTADSHGVFHDIDDCDVYCVSLEDGLPARNDVSRENSAYYNETNVFLKMNCLQRLNVCTVFLVDVKLRIKI